MGSKEKAIRQPDMPRYSSNESNRLIVDIKKMIIRILFKIMSLQNDLRLTQFLREFYICDNKLVIAPELSENEYTYLHSLTSKVPVPTDEIKDIDEQRKECNSKIISWMTKSHANVQLDIRRQSKEKDIICILLDIILY